ncbi:MAG: ferrochelatase [Bdellovibrionales bacterium]|nr:ferrochelatase [Bdellovibrionales bacterium]
MKKALLLVNLGTPDDTTVPAVRRYLAEFLMDPYVIDIPLVARALLIYGIILPTRPAKSAAAYRQIWTERGSPLLFHSEDLTAKVRRLLPDVHVELAMRYASPSIRSKLEVLRKAGAEEITVLPLYPQYSLAATASSVEKVKSELSAMGWSPRVKFVPAFYDHPGFIAAFAEIVRERMHALNPDYVLFSFHGLPERHVRKTDATGSHCLASENCCERMCEANRDCYRAQSFATARLMAKDLQLEAGKWSVSFQSRLGRTPWIKPYTDFVYPELAAKGFKRVLVVCPAFVADCLETLEEIAIRGREEFQKLGGQDLWLVPSLNSSDAWTQAVVDLATG